MGEQRASEVASGATPGIAPARVSGPARFPQGASDPTPLLLLGLLCLVLTAVAMPFDAITLDWFRELAPPDTYMRRVLKVPAHLFRWWSFAALFVVLLLQPRGQRRRPLIGFGVVLAGCNVALHTLKVLAGRARPDAGFLAQHGALYFDWLGDPRGGLDSFPSGHTAMTVLLVVLLGLYWRRLWWFLLVPAVLACLSRIAIERHFLSDVFAGAGLALLAMSASLRWLGVRYYPRLSLSALRRAGRQPAPKQSASEVESPEAA